MKLIVYPRGYVVFEREKGESLKEYDRAVDNYLADARAKRGTCDIASDTDKSKSGA